MTTAGSTDIRTTSWLLCRVGPRLCALPLEDVVENLRILPIERLTNAPRFVLGLCIIRGVPVPVVDIATIFGERQTQPRRMVTLRAGTRVAALAVEEVLGLRSIAMDSVDRLPPLLRDAAGDVVSAIGRLDAELLLLLRAARVVPDVDVTSLAAEKSVA